MEKLILIGVMLGFTFGLAQKDILTEKDLQALKEWYKSPIFAEDIDSYKDWYDNPKAAENFLRLTLKLRDYETQVSIKTPEDQPDVYNIIVYTDRVSDESEFVGFTSGAVVTITSFANWKTKYLFMVIKDIAWRVETKYCRQAFPLEGEGDPNIFLANLERFDLNPESRFKSQVTIDNNVANFYQNDQYDFSITFPDNWIVGKGAMPPTVVRADSKIGNEREHISVIVVELKEKGDISNVKIQDIFEQFKSANPSASLFGTGEISLSGEKALWLKCSVTHNINKQSVVYQVITIHRRYMFFITASVVTSTIEKALDKYQCFEPVFKKAIGSFRFEDWRKEERARSGIDLNLVLLTLLTWAICLSIPIFLRFVIFKKAIRNKYAIPIVFVLVFFNVFMFKIFGFAVTFGFEIILIGGVSWALLQAGLTNKAQNH